MVEAETYILFAMLFGIFLMLCFIGLSMAVALRARLETLDSLERQLLDSYSWFVRAVLAISLGLGVFLAFWGTLALIARFI